MDRWAANWARSMPAPALHIHKEIFLIKRTNGPRPATGLPLFAFAAQSALPYHAHSLRMPKKTRAELESLEKTPTGISGFDEITYGGLPKNRPTLVAGTAGCGKTL